MGKKTYIVILDLMQRWSPVVPRLMVSQRDPGLQVLGPIGSNPDGSDPEAPGTTPAVSYGRITPTVEQTKFAPSMDVVGTTELIKDLDKDMLMNSVFHDMITNKTSKVNIRLWKSGDEQDIKGNTVPVYNYSRIEKEMMPFLESHDHPVAPHFRNVFSILTGGKFNANDQEYKNAKHHLNHFVTYLIDIKLAHFNKMTAIEKKTTTGEPVVEKVKEVGRELISSFKKGDAMDKALMIGVGYMLYRGFTVLKGKSVPGFKFTFGTAFLAAGGYWGANYLSIKATGQSLPEHMGIRDTRDDLENSEYAAFAQHFEIEDKKTLDIMLAIGTTPMPRLINAYKKNRDATDPFIHPRSINFPRDQYKHLSKAEKKEVGRTIYLVMEKLSLKTGNLETMEVRYGDPKQRWTFGHAVWSEFALESFRERAGWIERMGDKLSDSFGTREFGSPDIRNFQEQIKLPDRWRAAFPDEDRTQPDDGRLDMTVAGILMHVTRGGHTSIPKSEQPVIGMSPHSWTFEIAGSKQSIIINPDKLGVLVKSQQTVFLKMMAQDVARRVKGSMLVKTDGTQLTPDDLTWDHVNGEWYIGSVTIPTLHGGVPITGAARISPIGENDARIHIEGAGVDIHINNHMENNGVFAQPFILEVSNQFSAALGDVAGELRAVATSQDQGTLQIGDAKLELTWNGDKWEAVGGAAALSAFLTHNDFIQKKVEVATGPGSALNNQIEQSKGAFYSMIENESRFGHFFKSVGEYFTDDLWDGKAPTFEGVSGSVILNYAESRLDAIKEEVGYLYAARLRSLGAGATPADIESAYKQIITEAIGNLSRKSSELKATNIDKLKKSQTWDKSEVSDHLDQVSALPYKNNFYAAHMLGVRHLVKKLDFAGIDNSDWAKGSHRIRAKLMGVISHYTAEFAIDGDLDKDDFGSHPEGDPRRDVKKERMRRQMYVEYVTREVISKALEFGGKDRKIDVVISHIPAPGSNDWDIDSYGTWFAHGATNSLENMYKDQEKLSKEDVRKRIEQDINDIFLVARKSKVYTLSKLVKRKKWFLNATRMDAAVRVSAAQENRHFQEKHIDHYRRHVLRRMTDKLNEKVPPNDPGWWEKFSREAKELWTETWN